MTSRDYRIDFSQVRAAAAGRWSMIYSRVTGFDDALKSAGRNRHVSCPICNRKRFRLFKDYEETGGGICTCGDYPDGFMLLRAVWGYGPDRTYELFKTVAEIVGGDHSSAATLPAPTQRSHAPRPKLDAAALLKLQTVHGQLIAVDQPPAAPMRMYLESRGIDWRDCPPDLMFHPSLPCSHERDDGSYEDLGKFPAMVGIVRNVRGSIVTLHRTYLTQNGAKASVPEPKKIMPKAISRSVAGSCIRFDPPGSTIHLAEGIETALSVRAVTGEPTWVAISANYLPAFARPPGVTRVVIWVDLDRSGAGNRFAQELADLLLSEGVSVSTFTPPGPIPLTQKSVDWNDVHRSLGCAGFPTPYYVPEAADVNDFEGNPRDC